MWRLFYSLFFCATISVVHADERVDFFESRIRPLLINQCVSCHGPDSQESDLRLDSRSQILEGTADVDPLVVAGQPDASRLLQVILYSDDDTQMPPKGRLSKQQIQDVRTWIQSGAAWPSHQEFGQADAFDPDAWKKHWAFQPVQQPSLPSAHQPDWHPVDSFVRQKLQQQNLMPAPTANGRDLARRLAYDITGLPPSLSALKEASSISDHTALHQWLNDYTDLLLASPTFGERWGRYWLDIARYADTKGYVFREDRAYPDAWKYREWVIQSLNDDMPYDQFLKRQIVADQLEVKDDSSELAAMGFFTLGRRFLNNKHDIIDDRIDVLTRGTLGLTVSCARCHDHKFDPIPTADYYSLYGIFDSSEEPKEGKSTLQLVDRNKPRQPVVFIRGQAGNRGPQVPRRFLTALGGRDDQPFTKGSGRLELAQQIASDQNPLTARVAVNRIWLRLFGKGLVESASDFGVRTPPPSHPELLDHLADYFITHNWSRKELIRYLTKSMTYRQSSAARPELFDQDPENRRLARMPKRRLNFEALRDSILAVSGQLDQSQVGGPSVDITKTPFPNRRTIYAHIDRQNLPGVFRTFDFASPDSHAAVRHETTVPQQALFEFNSDFMMEQAESAATSVIDASDTSQESQDEIIRKLYQQILKREPKVDEITLAESFLQTATPKDSSSNDLGWRYGWGELSAAQDTVIVFHEFPNFTDGRFAGGPKLPDPKIGWSSLNAGGGHPGGDLAHCVIRRWIADRESSLHITGQLQHKNENGDGVQGIVIYEGRVIQRQSVHNSAKGFDCRITVKAGQHVDFVTFCGNNESHDSFDWTVVMFQFADGKSIRKWDSEAEFSASPKTRLSPVAQLAQVLMMTNEFTFID